MISEVQKSYITNLSPESCKEMLRATSSEELEKLAPLLTENQFHYAILTLPRMKSDDLKNARLAFKQRNIIPLRR